jgi:hypothetical protein
VTESLRRLLQHPIDYAGVFPPASLDMRTALANYGRVMDSRDEWVINRFLCPVERLGECFEVLDEFEESGTGGAPSLDFGIIGTALESGETAPESLKKDVSEIKLAFQHGDVSTYEVRVPAGDALDDCVGALSKAFNWFDERDVELYVELPWSPTMGESMAKVASAIDGVGFKARTGGPKPENIPGIRPLAAFIADAAGLESTFKFTAGLHKPLRHYDSEFGGFQHGFLNVMIASALAYIQSASVSEVEQVLNTEDSSQFVFTDQTIEVGNHKLTLKDIDEWWLYFGGFGSCSFKEPIDGLRYLGWL